MTAPAPPTPDRRIVVVTAGLSKPSSTRMLADRLASATADALAAQGDQASVNVIELRDHAHAVVDATLTGFPSGALADALAAVATADALIAVTPLFTTTYSGLFKSFIDIIDPDALRGTPVLLGATGGTARHSLAVEYSMRPLFTYLRADVVTTSVFAATDDWSDGGVLAGADAVNPLPARIDRAARDLADRVQSRPARADSAAARDNEGVGGDTSTRSITPRPGETTDFSATPSFADLIAQTGVTA
ncbi:MAG: NAD(P)H-dependent oxidoreductase [Cellulomonadaceae bacterium]|jgi:FMN reductase|nr:NAD(P)H-dependent oxidoreductase [Cellulomonadaceae bacterium]